MKKSSYLIDVIETPGCKKSTQICHVNLLKLYHQQVTEPEHNGKKRVRPALVLSYVSVPHDGDRVPEPDKTLLYGQ